MLKNTIKIASMCLKITFVLILAFIFLASCIKLRTSDAKIYKKMAQQGVKVETYTLDGKSMRYVHTGNDTLPLVVFVHGAPGSSDAFFDYLKNDKLLQKCQMISIDRLGYGYSEFGKVEVSIEKQAYFIVPILKKYQNRKIILVGHSYGGPVVACLAMNYPEYVKGIILAAPAIDPENEKIFWFNKPASWKMVRWCLPRVLNVANDEKMAHSAQLKLLLPKWENIRADVTYIHGGKDNVVPFVNHIFAQKMLKNANVTYILKDKMNHFFPFRKIEILEDAILNQLKTLVK